MTKPGYSLFHKESFEQAIATLKEKDTTLAKGLAAYGPPNPLVPISPFPKLVKIIIGQQLSTNIAEKIYNRLKNIIGEEPSFDNMRFIKPDTLRTVGLSSTKANAITHLTKNEYEDFFSEQRARQTSESDAYDILLPVRGIGVWTVYNYLIFCCGHANIFPSTDGSLLTAVKRYYNIEAADANTLTVLSEHWSPHKSSAALILWRMIDQCKAAH